MKTAIKTVCKELVLFGRYITDFGYFDKRAQSIKEASKKVRSYTFANIDSGRSGLADCQDELFSE